MTAARTIQLGDIASATLILWIGRCLEGLWLLTVVLVPVAFLDRDYLVSEAVIAYVEVPKVALLRTLAGLMAVLWLIEWGIQGRLPIGLPSRDNWSRLLPGRWLPELKAWLQSQPTRWLILAVWFYLASVLLSTVLSGSFKVSLWGEVPGQDGYSAYNVIAYVLLFAVIASHLKTRPQLWRLFGAIAAMGVLVCGYAILQHYGHDFLDLTETTGGGTHRVTSFMGNAIFSAAVMMMTIPMSLLAASLTIRQSTANQGQLAGRVKPWLMELATTGLWGMVLSVQLIGLTFTLSRGSWIGAMVAILGFLCLSFVFVGWRFSLRAATLLALTVAFIMALLQWQGSVSYPGAGRWLGPTSALLGLVWIGAVFSPWRRIGRFALALGLTAAAVSVLLAVIWFKGDPDITIPAANPTVSAVAPIGSEVTERLSSIRSELQSGLIGGRATNWKVSWRLIRERQWFESDKLSLQWLRPLIGYGPDLFRFTYLLASRAEGRNLLPLEADHAHNYFIHQTVEQGLLGALSAAGIFAAVFIVGGYQLLRLRRTLTTIHKLLIIGLVVTIAGRFLEMIAGVARVSDMTILWVILATFAALPVVMQSPQVSSPAVSRPHSGRGRRTPIRRPSIGVVDHNGQLFWRLAVVAWLIGGIGMVTWLKAINYPRAAVKVSEAQTYFRSGDFEQTLVALDRAIDLASDVPTYYTWRANTYLSYQFSDAAPLEPGCSSQNERPYKVCLAIKAFENNLIGALQRPFYYRSQVALAETASNLTLNDQAARYFRTALSLVPASWPIRNELARAYIDAGQPESALQVLQEFPAITGDDERSSSSLFLQGMAYRDLGDSVKFVQLLGRSESLERSGQSARMARRTLAEHFAALGQLDDALGYYNEMILVDPLDATAYASRSRFYLEHGQPLEAVQDYVESIVRNPQSPPDHELASQIETSLSDLSQSQIRRGYFERALQTLTSAIRIDPDNALLYRHRGEAYSKLGKHQSAIEDLSRAIRLDPRDGNAYRYRGVSFIELGQYGPAVQDLNESIRLNVQDVMSYAYRGIAFDAQGRRDKALQNWDRAVRLDAEDSLSYYNRGLVYELLGQPESAVESFGQAIRLDSKDPQAYYHRGNANEKLGNYQRAAEDYAETTLLNPQDDRAVYRLGFAYLHLGKLEMAVDRFSQALSLEPANAQYYRSRGEAYAGLGQSERALENLDFAIGLDPNDSSSYVERGKVHFGLGALEHTLKDYRHAIRLDPKNPVAFLSRGDTYRELAKSSAYDSGYLWSGPTFSVSLNEEFFESGGNTYRVVIPHELLSFSGEDVRVTMQSRRNAYGAPVTNVFIGHAPAGGNPWDFDSNQVRLTWDGGNDGFSLPVNSSIVSDIAEFSLNSNKDLIVAWDTVVNSTPYGFSFSKNVPGAKLYSKRATQAASEDSPDGLSSDGYGPGWLIGVSQITLKTRRVDFTSTSVSSGVGDSPDNPRIIWFIERAIEDYDEAIRLDVTEASTYLKRGLSYGEIGQHRQAIQNYSDAIRLDPQLAEAYSNRATAYSQLGQLERAAEDRAAAQRLHLS